MLAIDDERFKAFQNFFNERHNIWKQREQYKKPRPWTDDPVLQRHHFTNVYRRLDKGSLFAEKTIREIIDWHGGDPGAGRTGAWFWVVTYRPLNRIETFKEYDRPFVHRDPHSVDRWLEYIDQRYKDDKRVRTGRHYTRKRSDYSRAVRDAVWIAPPMTAAESFTAVRTLAGVGRFIGWQMVADMMEYGLVGDPCDELSTVPGPGAIYAQQMMCESKSISDRVWGTGISNRDHHRTQVLINHLARTAPSWIDHAPPDNKGVTRIDIEHALCEWMKYEKLWYKRNRKA
jgi:hypothetical protein